MKTLVFFKFLFFFAFHEAKYCFNFFKITALNNFNNSKLYKTRANSFSKEFQINSKNKNKELFFIDSFFYPDWLLINLSMLKVFIKKYNVNFAVQHINPLSKNQKFLLTKFIKKKNFYRVKLKFCFFLKAFRLFLILDNLKDKKALFNFKLNNIDLGIDIYESILRKTGSVSNLNNFNVQYYLFLGSLCFYFYDYLTNKFEIVSGSMSHDAYIEFGLFNQFLYRDNKYIYFLNNNHCIRVNKKFAVHDYFKKISNYSKFIDNKKLKSLIANSNKQLNKRISGDTNVKMPWQLKSAFHNKYITKNIIENKNKINILILTHCFFDNPHPFKKNSFLDFSEWLENLCKLEKKYNYDWYIKPHRDYLEGTLEIIDNILKKYKNIKFVDPETSYFQLKREGIDLAITNHGSAGHELPLIGIPVINTGFNPHISYRFCNHFNNYDELIDYLYSIKKNNFTLRNKNKIYEYFSIHKYIINNDSFFFNSFTEYLKSKKHDLDFENSFKFFIKKNNLRKLSIFQNDLSSFINSKYEYSFEYELQYV